MSTGHCEIAVIGGGISGLTLAWHLKRGGRTVSLLERNPTVGGATRTLAQDGYLLEQGPFNILVRDPSFEELLTGLSSDIDVVQAGEDAKVRYIYNGRELVPLNKILFNNKLLGFGAKLRLLSGLLLARRPSKNDPTIADFASRRFGPDFAENIMGAAVSGIYGGDIHQLSLRACFPAIADIDRDWRSLVFFGLSAPFRKIGKPKKKKRTWKGLVSVSGGLGMMSDALGKTLKEGLLTGCTVTSVKRDGSGYVLTYQRDGAESALKAERVVLATPALETSELLTTMQNNAASRISEILVGLESVPLVVLNLGFDRADIGHDLKGFGFLVPPSVRDFPLMGVLWADSIFPEHAPPDKRLLRIFIGGSRSPELTTCSDEELVDISLRELKELLQINGRPTLVNSCPYREAIPQYRPGHTDKVQRIRELVDQLPELHLIGNYLNGVSLNDCIREAKEEALRILGTSDEAAQHSTA